MRKQKTPALYHFTCEHGREGIARTGTLIPRTHPFMQHLGPLLWLTDLAEPTPESVGLTSTTLSCDRLAHRFIVQSHAAVRWTEIRRMVPRDVVESLEAFSKPAHWWIVRRPLTSSEFSLDDSWTHTRGGIQRMTWDEYLASLLAEGEALKQEGMALAKKYPQHAPELLAMLAKGEMMRTMLAEIMAQETPEEA